MSAGGDDKQVKTAKDTLQNAIIGVFMILLAFGISSFVLEQAVQITGNDQAQSGGGGGGGESAGAPGSGSDSVSETGGSICRCPCAQSTLSLPVTACNATCSAESCRSSCGILGGLDGTPSCGAAGAEAPLGGDLGLTCNCECNIGGRVSNVDPGTVAGVCNATPGGSCATACTNACRVAGGAPSSIGATCGAPRGDTRVPSARCETTVGIGIAPYNATIRTGGLCTCTKSMRRLHARTTCECLRDRSSCFGDCVELNPDCRRARECKRGLWRNL
jgi:hypothetical protein